MKKRIALGAAMLLTLGTAVAGTFLYGHELGRRVEQVAEQQITLPSDNQSIDTDGDAGNDRDVEGHRGIDRLRSSEGAHLTQRRSSGCGRTPPSGRTSLHTDSPGREGCQSSVYGYRRRYCCRRLPTDL